MMRIIIAAIALSLTAAPGWANDLDWRDVTPRLEGCWSGTGMGGTVSECWVVAEDGRADGMFIIRREGRPYFAEIIAIDDFAEGVEMRLKHVNPDMTGWEEKDDFTRFKLTETKADALIFKGLTLRFEGDDRLIADLQMRFADGDVRTVPFNFVRAAKLNRSPTSSTD